MREERVVFLSNEGSSWTVTVLFGEREESKRGDEATSKLRKKEWKGKSCLASFWEFVCVKS